MMYNSLWIVRSAIEVLAISPKGALQMCGIVYNYLTYAFLVFSPRD